jgi:curli biogenesis system outer membrane secretion channel CsgG
MHKIKWKKTFGVGILGMVLSAAPVFAKAEPTPQEGTTAQELSALKARPLPQPGKVKVAVLPFTDSTGSIGNLRMGTVANYLLWQREGFTMLPLANSFKALKEDKEIEPGLALRRGDAARLGKRLGADWVVYGDIKELSHNRKVGLFKNSKYVIAGARIAVVEVASGETLYWHSRTDKTGGTAASGNSSATTLKRRGAVIVSMNATKPLFDILPLHQQTVKETPSSGEVAAMVESLWPGDKNND